MPSLRELVHGARGCLAERRLWNRAPTVGHVAELMAWFCLGELQSWPGHDGPTDPETREANLGPVLAHACRSGFITTGSQPGIDRDPEDGFEQRAAVDGLATAEVLAKLRALTAGTRLQIVAHRPSKWRRDYGAAVDVTRVGEHYVTSFGARLPPRDIVFSFAGVRDLVVDELAAMWQVTIVDPEWGAHSLLWDRLAQPDWDHPAPPAPAPPAAKPHTPTARPTTGGTAMSASIMEIKQALAQANTSIGDAQGPIQRAIDDATSARAAIQASMEGSSQADAEQQVAVLTAMIASLEDALGRSHMALDGNYSIAGRL
ncbi:DUF6919 domain-containing protein [Pseudonocardia broussonetiae]|uniref:DUF6919 domain-containing protein n=1 Tax=Pseudonocardia broussonetiae TaxID=2736640 RepID=A0A6M6JFB0_9PSEU|nr:hypothetical protein [Pseudonocardia broussonetiae]QJY46634.1 hypothetical protein HOP40_13080 [Pseudonocardia broussonetiae]